MAAPAPEPPPAHRPDLWRAYGRHLLQQKQGPPESVAGPLLLIIAFLVGALLFGQCR